MNRESLSRDAWLLTHFRNGWKMVMYLRGRPDPGKAVTWAGKTLKYPKNRPGFVDGLLEVWYSRVYQPPGFYKDRSDDVIVDLGANAGLFSIDALRNNPTAIVYAIEPSEENFLALQANLKTFCKGRAVPMRLACGKAASFVTVVPGPRSLDDKVEFIKEPGKDRVASVSLAELFDVISKNRIDYLKVDIEGSEMELFQDAQAETLKKIRHIAMEYHGNLRNGCLDLVLSRLSSTHHVAVAAVNGEKFGMLFATLL